MFAQNVLFYWGPRRLLMIFVAQACSQTKSILHSFVQKWRAGLLISRLIFLQFAFFFSDLTYSPFKIVKLLLFLLDLYLWTHICRCFSTGVTQERPVNMTVLFKHHKPVHIAKMSEVSYSSRWCESVCTHCGWVRSLAYPASELSCYSGVELALASLLSSQSASTYLLSWISLYLGRTPYICLA